MSDETADGGTNTADVRRAGGSGEPGISSTSLTATAAGLRLHGHQHPYSYIEIYYLHTDIPVPYATNSYQKMSVSAGGRFMYFAFGSNLLKERLQLANPSATFHCTGRLKDHELNFGLYEKNVDTVWHGGVATICCCPGAEVWGVIWTLNNEDLPRLDKQEGVNMGIYAPLEVSVETDKGLIFCRTYQMKNVYACPPSPQYKQVVCLGAKQNGLPVEYLKRLEAIQTNNYSGPSMLDQIRIDMK